MVIPCGPKSPSIWRFRLRAQALPMLPHTSMGTMSRLATYRCSFCEIRFISLAPSLDELIGKSHLIALHLRRLDAHWACHRVGKRNEGTAAIAPTVAIEAN